MHVRRFLVLFKDPSSEYDLPTDLWSVNWGTMLNNKIWYYKITLRHFNFIQWKSKNTLYFNIFYLKNLVFIFLWVSYICDHRKMKMTRCLRILFPILRKLQKPSLFFSVWSIQVGNSLKVFLIKQEEIFLPFLISHNICKIWCVMSWTAKQTIHVRVYDVSQHMQVWIHCPRFKKVNSLYYNVYDFTY